MSTIKFKRTVKLLVSPLLFLGAYLLPLLAGIGKSLGNTYGLTVILFGAAALTAHAPWGLILLSALIACNLFIVSLNMEGRSVNKAWKNQACDWNEWLKRFFRPSDSGHDDSPPPICDRRQPNSVLDHIQSGILHSTAYIVAILVAVTKGLCMAFGVISILPIASNSVGGGILIAISTLAVGAASLCKEGRHLIERMCGKALVEADRATAPQTLSVPHFLLSFSLPLLAAIVKSVGYAFGAVSLLTLWGLPFPALLTCGVMMAISLFTTSLCMEGAAICIAIQNRFQLSDVAIDKKLAPFSRIKLRASSGVWAVIALLSTTAKSFAMLLGSFNLLTEWHLAAPIALALSITAAIGVAAVVLFKEGKHFFLLANGCSPSVEKEEVTRISEFIERHISYNIIERRCLLAELQSEEARMPGLQLH